MRRESWRLDAVRTVDLQMVQPEMISDLMKALEAPVSTRKYGLSSNQASFSVYSERRESSKEITTDSEKGSSANVSRKARRAS